MFVLWLMALGWALGETPHQRLTVKFRDDYDVQLDQEGSLLGEYSPELHALISRYHLRFAPLIKLSEQQRKAIERKAESHSHRPQPNLSSMMVVQVDVAISLEYIKQKLAKNPLFDYVYLQRLGAPPPGDILPLTDDYEPYQSYLDEEIGLGVRSFWAEGLTGEGVALADIEYGWEITHEDLLDQVIWVESGQTIPDFVHNNGWDRHGTAVLGETSAVNNGYGCTGIAYDASVFLFPEYSEEEEWRRETAIAKAVQELPIGSVIMLEIQDYGDPACGIGESCLVPAEVDPNIWAMTRVAVDAGLVVVAAAGNGSEDLDGSWYVENWLELGDSGAIIVGAGTADSNHNSMGYSTGSRIDLQGWGEDVFTLGYGLFPNLNNDPNQSYTPYFSGTSAAVPMVAGVAVLLQDWALEHYSTPLKPEGLRQLLIDSGKVQGSGGNIGLFPDISAALELLLECDADADGVICDFYGGSDCDDNDSSIYPGAEEIWYDGIDSNCDEKNDYDADGDGFDVASHGGDDCDDGDSAIYPGAADSWYDGIDGNCDGLSDYDADGDGGDSMDYGGGDCDDSDADVGPHVQEQWYDGFDQNCDGLSDYDADGDGMDSMDYGGEDCDDSNSAIYPGAAESWYDGIDGDCAGGNDFDADGDGFDSMDYGGADCDDSDAQINPIALEIEEDGIDQNCSGSDLKERRIGCFSATVPLGWWMMAMLWLYRRE